MEVTIANEDGSSAQDLGQVQAIDVAADVVTFATTLSQQRFAGDLLVATALVDLDARDLEYRPRGAASLDNGGAIVDIPAGGPVDVGIFELGTPESHGADNAFSVSNGAAPASWGPILPGDWIAFDLDGSDLDGDSVVEEVLFPGGYTLRDRRFVEVVDVAKIDADGNPLPGENLGTPGMEVAALTVQVADEGGDLRVSGPRNVINEPGAEVSAISSGDALQLDGSIWFADTSGNVGPLSPYRILAPVMQREDAAGVDDAFVYFVPFGRP